MCIKYMNPESLKLTELPVQAFIKVICIVGDCLLVTEIKVRLFPHINKVPTC